MIEKLAVYTNLLLFGGGGGAKLKQINRREGCALSLRRAITLVFFLQLILAPCHVSAFRLLLDPGHDRQSPSVNGCECGIPEYVFNYNLAQGIEDELLQSLDMTVELTHDAQGCISLRGRARMTQGFDLMLSIHHDSAQSKYLRPVMINGKEKGCVKGPEGFCIYVSHENPYPEASLMFAQLLSSFIISKGFTPSTHHGEDIPGERHTMIAPGVYYYDNLIVLKEARCPAVLLEAAVLTNVIDEAAASSQEFQQELAAAVREALTTYSNTVNPKKPDLVTQDPSVL